MMGLSTKQAVLVVMVALIAVVTAGTPNVAYIAGRLTMAVGITLVAMRAYNSGDRGAATT